MITFCQSAFQLKEGQTLSKNVENKLHEFARQESELFYYIFNMNRIVANSFLCQENKEDVSKSLRACALEAYEFLINRDFDKFAQYGVEKQVRDDAYKYVASLRKAGNTERIERIQTAIDFIKKNTNSGTRRCRSCRSICSSGR